MKDKFLLALLISVFVLGFVLGDYYGTNYSPEPEMICEVYGDTGLLLCKEVE